MTDGEVSFVTSGTYKYYMRKVPDYRKAHEVSVSRTWPSAMAICSPYSQHPRCLDTPSSVFFHICSYVFSAHVAKFQVQVTQGQVTRSRRDLTS